MRGLEGTEFVAHLLFDYFASHISGMSEMKCTLRRHDNIAEVHRYFFVISDIQIERDTVQETEVSRPGDTAEEHPGGVSSSLFIIQISVYANGLRFTAGRVEAVSTFYICASHCKLICTLSKKHEGWDCMCKCCIVV